MISFPSLRRLYERLIKYLLSAVLMLYSLTVGLFTAKGQYIHSLICLHFGFAFRKPALPLVDWPDLTSPEPLQLVELEIRPGNMTVAELAVICGIIRREKPLGLFEIGTMDGRTTLNMALNAPPEARVYTLDLPADAAGETRYAISARYRSLVEKDISGERIVAAQLPAVANGRIVQLLGDSAAFDYGELWGKMDFVFIDGSHDYEYVINDTEVALKLLRNRRGTILWHDYKTGVEVVPALAEMMRRYPDLQIRHIRDTSLAWVRLGG